MPAPPTTARSQRFLRACRLEPVDRTPVWFMRQAGRSQPEYRALRERYSFVEICRHPDLVAEITLRPAEQLGVDAAILFADIMLPLSGLGVAFDLEDGQGPRIPRPVRTHDDVAALRPFEIEPTVAAVLQGVRLIRAASPVPLIGFAGAPFTLASYLIEGGPSREFLYTKGLMHQAPEVWNDLMTRLTDMTVGYLRAQIAAGAQAVQLFDSWVGCLGLMDYAEGVAPHMRRLMAALAGSGVPVIHFGTGTAGLLEQMAAAGGDVIGVDWRVSLAAAWARIGRRGIQGNLDPAIVLGPPERMERHAGAILAEAARRPGHIFNLGHGVHSQTDPDRLRRLADFVHLYSAEYSEETRR